ncbi:MAG: hypothetical protein HUU15_07710 [Candidatus Brocadiae bacterium]|nr:hypothetical protein [Candidatus Brocadiia bacterium]
MGGEDLQRIGEILIEEGAVLAEDIARAGEDRKGSPVLKALLESGAPARGDLARFLAATYQIPHIQISALNIPEDVIAAIPGEMANRHEIVPVEKAGGVMFIAKANFFNRAAVSDVRKHTGCKVKVLVAPEDEVQAALRKYYPAGDEAIQVAAPVTTDLPAEIVRSTGNTKRYTAPPGRQQPAIAATDRIAMLFTEDWAPAKKNGTHGPTSPMKAVAITKEEFQLAERNLQMDQIRQWERLYAAADPIPATRMSK